MYPRGPRHPSHTPCLSCQLRLPPPMGHPVSPRSLSHPVSHHALGPKSSLPFDFLSGPFPYTGIASHALRKGPKLSYTRSRPTIQGGSSQPWHTLSRHALPSFLLGILHSYIAIAAGFSAEATPQATLPGLLFRSPAMDSCSLLSAHPLLTPGLYPTLTLCLHPIPP